MKKTTESRLLRKIRRCALWAFLASALGVLVLGILEAWEVISTYDEWGGRGYGGGNGMNGWGKIDATLTIIMGISLIILLALLVSSRTKKSNGCGKNCCCEDCCGDDCCKDDAPAAKAAPVTMAAPKVAAKAAAPKKAAPKK